MKRLIVLFFLSTSIMFSQGSQFKSLETLKYEFNQNVILENNETIVKQYKARKKSRGLAFIYSAILPGMGELYAEGYSSGKYFTIAEGVLLGSLIGVSAYAENQKNNYRSYAEVYGGVTLAGKSDKYFADISAYLDIYEFNHVKDLERSKEVYNEKTQYWKWNSQTSRREFRKMWKASETASNSTRFIVGALLLNRVASVINAIRLVNRYNNNLKTELGWDVSFNYSNGYFEGDKISMDFRASF